MVNPEHLMLVNATPSTRRIVDHVLQEEGLGGGAVPVVISALGAVEYIGRHVPALMVVDCSAQCVEGAVFLDQVYDRPALRQVPVVVILAGVAAGRTRYHRVTRRTVLVTHNRLPEVLRAHVDRWGSRDGEAAPVGRIGPAVPLPASAIAAVA